MTRMRNLAKRQRDVEEKPDLLKMKYSTRLIKNLEVRSFEILKSSRKQVEKNGENENNVQVQCSFIKQPNIQDLTV